MGKIPFIDISNINCWIVYLIPFCEEERHVFDLVNSYQQECIKENVFGMGWDVECKTLQFNSILNSDNEKKYICCYEDYRELQHMKRDIDQSHKNALKEYGQMKKGDYVIMRLKNSHYYIGKISANVSYLNKKESPYNRLSWGAYVEEWVELENDDLLPSELVGRFSQKQHSTVQKICSYRQKLLLISCYNKNAHLINSEFDMIPKLKLSKNNFVRSLNYKQLEDLVAFYIAEKHVKEGYLLIPSSCKLSQQKFEYRFVKNNGKPITCQVKNQAEISIDEYVYETSYEKIYIFSGVWNDKEIDLINQKYSKYSHLHVISNEELYNTLRNCNMFDSDYYCVNDSMLLPNQIDLSNYDEVKQFRGYNSKAYNFDDMFINFIKKDTLFYSSEFEALILYDHFHTDLDEEEKTIQRILETINISYKNS